MGATPDVHGGGTPPRFLVGIAGVFIAMTVLMGTDLAFDGRVGAPQEHYLIDVLIAVLGLGGSAALAIRLIGAARRTHLLRERLRAAEGEAQRFREESRAYLRGLAVAIDRQLERWALSPAEREVVLLLLKGLSHKEIASIRACSERTVRHQSRAVYRKAGLAGRIELAAFFLEDLLLPPSSAGAPERAAARLKGAFGAPDRAGT